MNFKFHYITLLLIVTGLQITFAQKKEENIGTEVVNVVKPYTPTIADAFKVKETPTLDDEETLKKETIKYNIFSFPVASTFTPSKGVAANVEKSKQERLFNNYLTLGFGTYATANAELFVTENISSNEYIGGMLRHQSSQGNIKGVELDDKFYDTSLDLSYSNKQPELNWKVDVGYQNQIYNWYGLPAGFGSALTPQDRWDLIRSIKPQHTFHNFYSGGKLTFNESIFSEMALKYNRFWDDNGSTENNLNLKPSLKLDIAGANVLTNLSLDYINTSFDRYYGAPTNNANNNLSENQNSYFSVGINPNYQLLKNDVTLNLGATIVYLSTIKDVNNGTDFGSKNGIYFYPKVTASYKVVGDLMIAYGGVEGGLQQNSYRDFTNQNPFLSPTLTIRPTDAMYDAYIGLKGKLANSIAYNLRGSYTNERNKALFKANNYTAIGTNKSYELGNSFGVVYDNIKTIGVFGELKADLSKKVALGINATFNSFSTDVEKEAWNLPGIQLGATLDVNITEKWFAGANLFFVGERKDTQFNINLANNGGTVTLDSYFDANLNLGYQYNKRLTAFLRANNIANQAYQKWLNYPVQQLQLVLGANYKFDF